LGIITTPRPRYLTTRANAYHADSTRTLKEKVRLLLRRLTAS
jgi:hypothetical protein